MTSGHPIARRAARAWIAVLAILAVCVPLQSGQDPPPRVEQKKMFQLSDLTLDQDAQLSVLGARKVDPKLFPASFFSKDVQCTSSLVGPRALLTAAHCVGSGETISIEVGGQEVSGVCTQAPGFDKEKNRSPDYALCLMAREITETPFFETVNTDPTLLSKGLELLLTGFGCTKAGGGGDTSGTIYRVGEATLITLPSETDNRMVTKGEAAVCFGDSGGAAFIQQVKDGGPRIQVSVNAIGNIRDISGLASLSTPEAMKFLTSWSSTNGAPICGHDPQQTKCRPFP